jgi:hypothetical protein
MIEKKKNETRNKLMSHYFVFVVHIVIDPAAKAFINEWSLSNSI